MAGRASYIAPIVAVAMLAAAPAARAEEPPCAEAVRALMHGEGPKIPHRLTATTTMPGGQTIVNRGENDAKGGHLTMDENGVPVSLFITDRFYTSPDKGQSWTLIQTYSAEVIKDIKDGLATQAKEATNIVCDLDAGFEDRPAHHYAVDYRIHSTGTPMHSEYWVEPDTGFAFRSVTVSDPGTASEITILQLSEKAPDVVIPDPGK